MGSGNISVKILLSQFFSANRLNRKNQDWHNESRWNALKKQARSIFYSLTATIFTASLFLGGSYFFFVQLAEYGWH